MEHTYDYGLWSLVIINSVIFIAFAFSFTKPSTKYDWRSFGMFSAFIIALFTEMYGFPLTIYFLSGWLAQHYPDINFFSHENGHLWHTLLGLSGNAHFNALHIVSNVLILLGFWLLASAWKVLYGAQITNSLATSGAYSYIRHPQYAAFVIIMVGFLLQWPTLLTVIMFPILVYVYIRLARHEESLAVAQFGETYKDYMNSTPAFIPVWERLFEAIGKGI
jgi:protein-S-isoprenylcysteine O-methyltransferase Ste14